MSKECLKERFSLDFKPDLGRPSEKAERLAKFCLGEYHEKPAPACSGNLAYLENKSILLLEVVDNYIELSAGLPHTRLDQKKIVNALIDQRAAIPNSLMCWLVRGDGAGISTEPGEGLHIAGMRKLACRNIALVPTANRERYLGLHLMKQLDDFRQLWVPWEEKTDTAWWGGALTGSHWSTRAPCTLTRQQILYHFRDHPSDQVHLQLTKLQSGETAPDGIKVMSPFTKARAFMNKCIILLPGNDVASGLSWYFAGNSVVLMPKPHLEHILCFEMEPWEHYVPLENDPQDVLVKLNWVLENQQEAKQIVSRSHERLRWLSGPEYQWACNEVLNRLAIPRPGA